MIGRFSPTPFSDLPRAGRVAQFKALFAAGRSGGFDNIEFKDRHRVPADRVVVLSPEVLSRGRSLHRVSWLSEALEAVALLDAETSK